MFKFISNGGVAISVLNELSIPEFRTAIGSI